MIRVNFIRRLSIDELRMLVGAVVSLRFTRKSLAGVCFFFFSLLLFLRHRASFAARESEGELSAYLFFYFPRRIDAGSAGTDPSA